MAECRFKTCFFVTIVILLIQYYSISLHFISKTVFHSNFVLFDEEYEHLKNKEFITINIKQPTSIYINDGATFVLHADYCHFSINHSSVINNKIINLIDIDTRCYCWNYSESIAITVKIHSFNKHFNKSNYYCSIPGPTLYIKNNISFNINLINDMDGVSYSDINNALRSFPDVTNIHTHGLHINPIFDNVFKIANPKQNITYNYEIPEHHYPGTHWYHSHLHGSANYQIHGGMFGALIVETQTDTKRMANLISNNFDEITDIILHFHYYYFYTDEKCICDNNQSNDDLLNNYGYRYKGYSFKITSLCYDWCAMPLYMRNISAFKYTAKSDVSDENGFVGINLLNGQFQPIIHIQANKWYKLRMINANGMYYVQFNFYKLINKNLCYIYLIGNDGILFHKSRDIRYEPYNNEIIIPPGSRADILIKCKYNKYDNSLIDIKYSNNILTNEYIPRFPKQTYGNSIAFYLQIHKNDNIHKHNNKTDIKPKYYIPKYPNYLTINKSTNINNNCSCDNNLENNKCYFELNNASINGYKFDKTKPLLSICKDNIYEFEIFGNHPFHIHNTPFQIQRNLPNIINNVSSDLNYNGFIAMNGDWRDTVGSNDYSYKIRYPTQHSGHIITHCHHLPHEDDGMIGYFDVVDCDKNMKCKI